MANTTDGSGDHTAVPGATLGQLRVISVLARRGSFQRAADDLGTSRTYVWQQIKRLEEVVRARDPVSLSDMNLTEPGTGRLTEAGRAIADVAARVLEELDAVDGTIRDIAARASVARVACLPAQAPLVAMAAERVGTGEIQLADADDVYRTAGGAELVRRLRSGEVDVVIASRDANHEGLNSWPLYRWRLAAVLPDEGGSARPRRGQAHTIELTDLLRRAAEGTRLLLSPRDHVSRELVERAVGPIAAGFESTSVDALFALARQGWGIALIAGDALPLRYTAPDVRRNWPIVAHDGRHLSHGYSTLLRATTSDTSPARQLVDALQQIVRSDPSFTSNFHIEID